MRYWRLYWLYATIMVACGLGIMHHLKRTYVEQRDERYSQLDHALDYLTRDEASGRALSPALAAPCTIPHTEVCSTLKVLR